MRQRSEKQPICPADQKARHGFVEEIRDKVKILCMHKAAEGDTDEVWAAASVRSVTIWMGRAPRQNK